MTIQTHPSFPSLQREGKRKSLEKHTIDARRRAIGGPSFLTAKPVLRLLITSKSFGGRNAAAPKTLLR